MKNITTFLEDFFCSVFFGRVIAFIIVVTLITLGTIGMGKLLKSKRVHFIVKKLVSYKG